MSAATKASGRLGLSVSISYRSIASINLPTAEMRKSSRQSKHSDEADVSSSSVTSATDCKDYEKRILELTRENEAFQVVFLFNRSKIREQTVGLMFHLFDVTYFGSEISNSGR